MYSAPHNLRTAHFFGSGFKQPPFRRYCVVLLGTGGKKNERCEDYGRNQVLDLNRCEKKQVIVCAGLEFEYLNN